MVSVQRGRTPTHQYRIRNEPLQPGCRLKQRHEIRIMSRYDCGL